MTGAAAAPRGIRRRPAAQSWSAGSPAPYPTARRYSYVPERLIPDPVTKVELERKLLAAIASSLDHRGYCPLSVTALAKCVGSHRLSVSVQMAAMKYAGIIRRWEDADGRFVTVIVDGRGGGDAAGEPSPVAGAPVA